jgi:hypothetical protein
MARPVPVPVDHFLPALYLIEAKPRPLSAGSRPGSPASGRSDGASGPPEPARYITPQ